ncbi:hypothetical protein CSA37_08670 [Candidatus Fermentibacteria bacterium]|nr:MAG: hypothetical protein CSA37_08670 [Candidatus Fermentibacteria bacterium]
MNNKIAAVPLKLVPHRETNLRMLMETAEQAALAGAELVVFPEASLTGLNISDCYNDDVKLCETVPGSSTVLVGNLCRRLGISICFGLMEIWNGTIYDSAVLIDQEGKTALHYRRISPGWRAAHVFSHQYSEGNSVPVANTHFGRTAVILCGDLFSEDVHECLKMQLPDLLLVPMARSLPPVSNLNKYWKEELEEYASRVEKIGIKTVLVNSLWDRMYSGDPTAGGAWVISAQGRVEHSLPLNCSGFLLSVIHDNN